MTLTLSAAPQILKLDPRKWGECVKSYIKAKQDMKDAESAARGFKVTVETLRAQLREALNGHTAATCGHAVLTATSKAPVPGALTLTTGEKVLLANVTSVLVGNRTIPASEVQTWFGGRAGSEDIAAEGTP